MCKGARSTEKVETQLGALLLSPWNKLMSTEIRDVRRYPVSRGDFVISGLFLAFHFGLFGTAERFCGDRRMENTKMRSPQ